MLTGVTLIRNGNLLNYPWKLCIKQLQYTCDQIIVNCDPGQDNTMEELLAMSEKDPRIKVIPAAWDMGNTGDGRELAVQANAVLPWVGNPWVLYVQADELIHQKDSVAIRQYLSALPQDVTQVELYRSYFWENIHMRAQDDEIWLGRIFRAETHEVGGDGMYLIRKMGQVARSPFWIYHYSRVGTEEQITNRVRTLDRLFHPEDEVQKYDRFSYTKALKNKHIVPYMGTHPQGVEEFYGQDTSVGGRWVC